MTLKLCWVSCYVCSQRLTQLTIMLIALLQSSSILPLLKILGMEVYKCGKCPGWGTYCFLVSQYLISVSWTYWSAWETRTQLHLSSSFLIFVTQMEHITIALFFHCTCVHSSQLCKEPLILPSPCISTWNSLNLLLPKITFLLYQ